MVFSVHANPSWIALVFTYLVFFAENSLGEHTEESGTTSHEEEHVHPAHAVLFPSFVLTLGVLVYYVLSRYLHFLPYTAVMFLLGTIMGLVAATHYKNGRDGSYMNDTLIAWQNIDSEVLLLVFLPGLIFKDALGQNVYLFTLAFGQLLIFAFPLVLAGTCLAACIGYYVFPYSWPFSLCLTFGSILAATDPVAVAALLDEVGAPPRLKTHIAGESLLNDGAAIVFFFIFSNMFYHDLGMENIGESIDLAEGVKLFCQKALGGAALGLVIGSMIVLVLAFLNRRFGREENIVQVTAVFGMVYLGYFVSDLICATSGVIATVAAGLTVKFFGRDRINNIHLMDDFFCITEHILNTVLFCLGGVVWGRVIIDNNYDGYWTGKDWGYLILLYVLLHIIRAFLFLSVFPITKRIGLKTSWSETVFQIYGGLRGAVGIALAIALDNETAHGSAQGVLAEQKYVSQAYQMIGGVAFLTLVVNGISAGPVLIYLGLADATEAREKIIEAYRIHLRALQIDSFVKLLTNDRFKSIDFSFVRDHIPFLKDMTLEQLMEAVVKLKESTPTNHYSPPYLENVLPLLKSEEGLTSDQFNIEAFDILKENPDRYKRKQRMEKRKGGRASTCRSSMIQVMKGDPLSTKELRLLFISMLRAQYEHQINEGLLTAQHGLTVALLLSLEEAKTEVLNGGPLNDLQYLRRFHDVALKCAKVTVKATCGLLKNKLKIVEGMDLAVFVIQEIAFSNAHERAQLFFEEELGSSEDDLSEAGKIVIAESKRQLKDAKDYLRRDVIEEYVIETNTHIFCQILLNKGIKHVDDIVELGLLKDSEAEEIVEEIAHLLGELKHGKVNASAVKKESAEEVPVDGAIPSASKETHADIENVASA